MTKSKFILFLFLLGSCCFGCGSAVPNATTFPLQTQRKMQAAKHWQILAEDVAEQVKKCIVERRDLMVKPVYVIPKDSTPFEEIFQEILISKLVGGGVLVVKAEKEEVLKLEYSVRLLRHKDRYYTKFPMKFTALGTGVMVARGFSDWLIDDLLILGAGAGLAADVAMSHYAGGPSEREAIITTALSYDDYFFMHQSDIYYINDPDAGHYVEVIETAKEKNEKMREVKKQKVDSEQPPEKRVSEASAARPPETDIQTVTTAAPLQTQPSEKKVDAPQAQKPAATRRTFNVVD